MTYLQLSPDELIMFAASLKKQYGLIIVEKSAKVQLDELLYGSGWSAFHQTYKFSQVDKDGNKQYITIQNGDGKVLYAVTKHQYKCWKNWKVVSEPFGLSFGRIINCVSQIAHKYNLVSPAADLYKLYYFLHKTSNKGEDDG